MQIQRNNIAKKILSPEQLNLASLLQEFSSTHMLVGGTAVALQLAHRKSIDFDLFCFGSQGTGQEIMARIQKSCCMFDIDTAPKFWHRDEQIDELTLFFSGVKVQFIDFSRNPFDIPLTIKSDIVVCNGIPSLSLLKLGAMKVYAMMYRKKIKDIVDLYYILQHGECSLQDIIDEAQSIFGKLYDSEATYESIFDNERDMTETVEYVIENPPTYGEIFEYIRRKCDMILLNSEIM